MEALCRHYGLYLTCDARSGLFPCGNFDLMTVLNHASIGEAEDGSPARSLIWRGKGSVKNETTSAQVRINKVVLWEHLRVLLLSRLLVFKMFRECFKDSEESKRKWLLMQARPTSILVDVERTIRTYKSGAVLNSLPSFVSELPQDFIIVIDAAQYACDDMRSFFASPDWTEERGVLGPLV
jgi:hypothetical protein